MKTNTKPLFVIISGLPATGKTHFEKILSAQYNLPLFFKDCFKEMMYDNYEKPPEREMSRFMGKSSVNTLEIISTELLSKGISHIIESNFNAEQFNPHLKKLETQFEFDCIQIHLKCDRNILVDRFIERAQSSDIHPGHQGIRFIDEMKERLLTDETIPFSIKSETIFVDTTTLENIDYEPIFKVFKKYVTK